MAAALAATPALADMPLALSETEQAAPALPAILPPRECAALENRILAARLDTLIPEIMRAEGIDLWLLVAREYFEEPVVATMLDAENMHARRRTILIFHDPGNGKPVERLTVSRYGLGGLFAPAWNPEEQPDQWQAVADLIAVRSPAKIAINSSDLSQFADGMTLSQYDKFMSALPPALHERVTSGEGLANSNRVQDFLTRAFKTGRSGNEALAIARADAIAAGLDPSIYTHPIGYHGHGAGPSIGFWDNRKGDPRGQGPIRPNTAWSIELTSYAAVPEWGGQRVDFRTEEDAFFDGETVRYIDGRQTAITLIPSGG